MIHAAEISGGALHVECSPVDQHRGGRARLPRRRMSAAGSITRGEIPLERFAGDWFRFVVTDAAGRSAWSNPVRLILPTRRRRRQAPSRRFASRRIAWLRNSRFGQNALEPVDGDDDAVPQLALFVGLASLALAASQRPRRGDRRRPRAGARGRRVALHGSRRSRTCRRRAISRRSSTRKCSPRSAPASSGRSPSPMPEWAGPGSQRVIAPWTVIDGEESRRGVRRRRSRREPVSYLHGTSISGALLFASGLFEDNGFRSARQVIDVSGDGPNNMGFPVLASARDGARARHHHQRPADHDPCRLSRRLLDPRTSTSTTRIA